MYKQHSLPLSIVHKVVQSARDEDFPLLSFPKKAKDWIEAVSFSRNTRPEFVFLASLGVINSIVGPDTKIKIREGSNKVHVKHKKKPYEEHSGLFVTILCEPGSGKTTAFNLAVQDALTEQDDPILQSLLIQDYTRKGLFECLKSHNGLGLLASSEMQNFFDGLLRKQMDGYGERNLLNNLYDGSSQWVMTSAGRKIEDGKEKREELMKNSLCINGFAQPEPFINAYRPLAALRDGFTDRMLVCTIQPKLLKEEEVKVWDEKLEEFNLHTFHTLYKEIYHYHANGRSYVFDAQAKQRYIEFSDGAVNESNDQWAAGQLSTTNYSKDRRNLSRMALGLHIFLSTLNVFLEKENEDLMKLEDGEIPEEIDINTFNLALNIIEYFKRQREILNMVFDEDPPISTLKNGGNNKVKPSLVDANFSNNLYDYLLQLCEDKENISNVLLVRPEGVAFRAKEVANSQFSNEHLIANLKALNQNTQTKPLNFNKIKKRAFILPWSIFSSEMKNVLCNSIDPNGKVKMPDPKNQDQRSVDDINDAQKTFSSINKEFDDIDLLDEIPDFEMEDTSHILELPETVKLDQSNADEVEESTVMKGQCCSQKKVTKKSKNRRRLEIDILHDSLSQRESVVGKKRR